MKYGNRMCELLSDGQHVASVAVLYDGEADWTGGNMPMQKVIRQLLENQIDLDIVWLDLLDNLEDYNGKLDKDKLIVNGVEFNALIVGYTPRITSNLVKFIEHAGDFPVVFVDALPEGTVDKVCDMSAIQGCEVIALEQLADNMKTKGFMDIVSDTEFKDLSFYHYSKDHHIFLFQNESAYDTYKGKITLPIEEAVVYYDAMIDVYETAQYEIVDGKVVLSLELEPGECVIIMEQKNIVCDAVHKSFNEQLAGLESKDISTDWILTMTKAKNYSEFPKGSKVETLAPISDEKPTFSGIIRYEKTINLDEVPTQAVIKAEHVYEMMKVIVNGEEAGVHLFPPYQAEISKCLKLGKNTIVIEVATTPAREMLEIPQPPFDFSHEALEPSGMFGKIELYIN